MELKSKLVQLQTSLKFLGNVAVACSGGIDSSYLLKVTHDTLGTDNVLAVNASTTLQTVEEEENLQTVVNEIGCRLLVLEFDPYTWPEFVANPPDTLSLFEEDSR